MLDNEFQSWIFIVSIQFYYFYFIFFPAQELSWLFILHNSVIPNVKVLHTIFQLELDFLPSNIVWSIFPYPYSCYISFINISKILFIYSLCSMYLNVILIDYVILCAFYLNFQILMYFLLFYSEREKSSIKIPFWLFTLKDIVFKIIKGLIWKIR